MVARFTAAFQFLTVLPLFPARELTPRELARSMGAFPLVGLSLGAGLVVFHWVAGQRLPGALEGAVLVALLAWATGAFHLDGLADTADGLAGGWTRERALEIMKDSRTGAVGAAALAVAVVTKALALGLLPEGAKVLGLLTAPAVGRGAVVWLARGSTYARPGGGLAAYAQHLDGATVRLALLSSGVPCLLRGWRGVAAWGLTVLYAGWLRGVFHRRLGGITGDVLGLAAETGEIAFLLALHLLW
ncbi:MAG: adenosylcobinamide-GDP ribazoletransferase [Deferrisomatales bacterium]